MAYEKHDQGYQSGELDRADLILLNDISNLPNNPQFWGEGVNTLYSKLHSEAAFLIFGARQGIRQMAIDIVDSTIILYLLYLDN